MQANQQLHILHFIYAIVLMCFVNTGVSASSNKTNALTHSGISSANKETLPLRIVALSPHTVEILFALQLGEFIVGTSEYADYPKEAQRIPRIANHQTINFEQLIALQPTHLIVWQDAVSQTQLKRLRTFNIPLFISHPQTFAEVSIEVIALGKQFGRSARALQLTQQFTAQLDQLKQQYAARPPVSMIYVLWPKPLVVAGGKTWVSQFMDICGATNSFAQAVGSYPQISMEQVMLSDPDLIMESADIPAVSRINWKQWASLSAVRNQQITHIIPDEIERQTLRSAQGAKQFCKLVDRARQATKL